MMDKRQKKDVGEGDFLWGKKIFVGGGRRRERTRRVQDSCSGFSLTVLFCSRCVQEIPLKQYLHCISGVDLTC